jgi:hypothetical protein
MPTLKGAMDMTKRAFSLLMILLVIGLAAPSASANCWKCSIAGSRAMCEKTDQTDVGKDFCKDSSSCQPSGCSSTCQTSGGGCTGGSGGNCAVMADGTVICEEHKDVRTTNGEPWPEPIAHTDSACSA